MDKFDLGTVIAERDLCVSGGPTITVKVGMPRKFADDSSYFCPYEIIEWDRKSLRRAGGVDSIQAIQLAFEKIGVELYELNLASTNSLRWEGGEQGDLGFPLPQSITNILATPESVQETGRTSAKGSRSMKRAAKRRR